MNPKVKTYVIQAFADAAALSNTIQRFKLPPQFNNYYLRSVSWEGYLNDNVTGLLMPKATNTTAIEELGILLLDAALVATQITPPVINDSAYPFASINMGNSLKLNNYGKLTFENLVVNDSLVIQYRIWNKHATNMVDSAINVIIEIEPLNPEQ